MRKEFDSSLIITLLITLFLIIGCKNNLPEITTNPVENINATQAESGGKIISGGGLNITSYGICWDTISNPTITSLIWSDTVVKKEFTAVLSGLLPQKTYYIRAYAVNSLGTGYGDLLSFKTPPSVPLLLTSEVSHISENSAISGGLIYSDGGSNLTGSGIFWDTIPGPAIYGFSAADSTGSREYVVEIRGLKPDKTYYVRAYATNSLGTGYGEERELKTKKVIPLVTIFTITEKYLYSASVNVKSISLGGSNVTEYGVCWNTKPEPTTVNFKITKQYAPGRFRLRGLKAGTKYYVRLYTINEDGIHYGKEASFNSLGRRPKAETLAAYDLTESGAKFKAKVNAGFLPTTITFEYGNTEKYGQSIKTSIPLGKGGDSTVLVAVSGLKPGTPYHFRVKASNDLGTAYGKDGTFIVLITPELKGFTPITKNYRDTVFYITSPVSSSSGEFTYTSSDPKVAVIKDDKGIITGSGTCIITANQAPSGKYAAGSISTTFSMNVVDIDGNVYHTVAIDNQDWMKENLRVTRYRNGQPIQNVPENEKWISLTSGAFCWMKNDTTVRSSNYGALYNWYAVSDQRKICPNGWHVPTDAEWQVMERFLGMTFAEAEETVKRGADQGVQLKDSTGWHKNGSGSNSSEFSGLPAGFRLAETGDFHNVGADACWWTSTEDNTQDAWIRNMYYNYNSIYRIPDSKNSGFSIRCVRDKKK